MNTSSTTTTMLETSPLLSSLDHPHLLLKSHSTEEEEFPFLTSIPRDIQLYILSFCDLHELAILSRVSEWFYQTINHDQEADRVIWSTIAQSHYSIDEGDLACLTSGVIDYTRIYLLSPGFNEGKKIEKSVWKYSVHKMVTAFSQWHAKSGYYYSVMIVSPDRRSVNMRNCCNWDTMKANFLLKYDGCHYWDFIIEKLDLSDKSLTLCVGIERVDNGKGVLYSLPNARILENAMDVTYHRREENVQFTDMDVLSFILDLKNVQTSNTSSDGCGNSSSSLGSFHIFKNGVWIATIGGIQTEVCISYVPVLYGIGKHVVTIRRGKWRSCKVPAVLSLQPKKNANQKVSQA